MTKDELIELGKDSTKYFYGVSSLDNYETGLAGFVTTLNDSITLSEVISYKNTVIDDTVTPIDILDNEGNIIETKYEYKEIDCEDKIIHILYEYKEGENIEWFNEEFTKFLTK